MPRPGHTRPPRPIGDIVVTPRSLSDYRDMFLLDDGTVEKVVRLVQADRNVQRLPRPANPGYVIEMGVRQQNVADAELVTAGGVQQISDEAALWEVVDRVVKANPKQAEGYASGKDGLFGFFVGQVMKETNGLANPIVTSDLLHKRLGR